MQIQFRIVALTLCATAMIAWPVASVAAPKDGAKDKSPTTAPASGEANGPAKFYGAISAIDPKAGTFTIDDVVYSVVPETHMTKALDDSAATLADAVVGEPARGTYTTSAGGKHSVTKVRFGKKVGGKGGGKKKDSATKPADH
jgi:hypothetical protein